MASREQSSPVPLDEAAALSEAGGSDVSVLKAAIHTTVRETALHNTLRKGLCVVWFKTSQTPEPSCLSQRAHPLPKQTFQPTLPHSKFFHCPDTHLGKHRFDYWFIFCYKYKAKPTFMWARLGMLCNNTAIAVCIIVITAWSYLVSPSIWRGYGFLFALNQREQRVLFAELSKTSYNSKAAL